MSSLHSLLVNAKKKIASVDARRMAEFCFGISSAELILLEKKEIPEEDEKRFLQMIALRKKGHSVSEITGQRDFYGMTFLVTNDVLTPRPETEWLVEYALKQGVSVENIIDIGTGSGCISIAIASMSTKNILSVDISEKALLVAQKNAERLLHPDKNIIFRKSDLLTNITSEEIENAGIITNLPYIPSEDILPPEVILGDPALALFSGKDGLDLYRRFFETLPNSFAFCAFEFHPPQKEELQKILTQKFPTRTIEWGKDLHGDIRFGGIV